MKKLRAFTDVRDFMESIDKTVKKKASVVQTSSLKTSTETLQKETCVFCPCFLLISILTGSFN